MDGAISSEHVDEPALPGKLEEVIPLLERALADYRKGADRGDGGFLGIRNALWVAMFLVGMQVRTSRCHLLEPLQQLLSALLDLRTGNVHPALRPALIQNRKPLHAHGVELKGRCLATSDLLVADGMPRKDADAAVLKRARPLAERIGIEMTEKSLSTWRRDWRRARAGSDDPSQLAFWVSTSHEMARGMSEGGHQVYSQVAFLLHMDHHARRQPPR